MGKYDGIYLFCDLDGTLLDDEKQVPKANLDAITDFIRNGGGFGVATGRSEYDLNTGLDLSLLTAPCVLCNGAVLYDWNSRKYLDCDCIPRERTIEMVKRILELRPRVCIHICTDKAMYQLNPHPDRWIDPLIIMGNVQVVECSPEEVQGGWIKLVIGGPGEELDGLVDELGREEIQSLYNASRSGENYLDFTDCNADKGNAIKKFKDALPAGCRVLAIGDYYNDVGMLKAADVSAAPDNAPEDIRAMVDCRVCCNNAGAVADFLRQAL